MPKATIFEVAELAGVSIKTVSRVVNHEPNVRESTRERVDRAIAKLNYRPDQSARNLASHRSHLIGLVYDDPAAYELPSAGYVIQLQQGALKACSSAMSQLLIHPCNYREDDVIAQLKSLIEGTRPEGIILAAPLSNMPKIVNAIEETGTAYVRMSPGETNGKQYSVGTDDREISAEMTRYLASLGHRKIAFITGHRSHKAVANRFAGYRDGLDESKLNFSERLVVAGDNSIGSGESAAEKLLSRKRPPTAIFAANDDMAVGVIRHANRLGVDIPGELSVAGFDDIALARQIFPSLTTIRQPLTEMAERAALVLIEGESTSASKKGTEIVPSSLQIRESTGPAPAR
jgi:LacI family transcriptional regulator